jgi:hypothetical protein
VVSAFGLFAAAAAMQPDTPRSMTSTARHAIMPRFDNTISSHPLSFDAL